MISDTIKVLLTAIGCPGGPSIIQSLREDSRISIIGTDMREDVPGKYLVDKYYCVPPGRDKNYIETVLQIVKREKVDVILPLATFELENLAYHTDIFNENNCTVCVSDFHKLEIANNRYLLYEKLKDHDFIPRYEVPISWEDMEQKLSCLGFPEKKVVIKPFVSHGSRGLRIISETVDLFENYYKNKPGSLEISPVMLREIFRCQKVIDDILLTEYLPGRELGVDLLLAPESARVISGVVRDNGDVSLSEITKGVVIDNSELLQMATKIAENLNLKYAINLDFKCDYNGKPMLMEINPRLPATSFLATSAGLNLPLFSIYLAIGESFSAHELNFGLTVCSYRGFMIIDNKNKVINRC